VGIASMQGVAFARALTIVPVSTLEALAREAGRARTAEMLIAPWVDAQRGEVFAALYAPDARTLLAPPTSAPPADTLLSWRTLLESHPVVFAGDGALRYRESIRTIVGELAQVLDPIRSLAPAIGRIAASEPERAVLPHAVVPIYVRRSDAELARDRKERG
jgi:tRNA threonylcarbamoyladenosine biosynthesis protein TsaB